MKKIIIFPLCILLLSLGCSSPVNQKSKNVEGLTLRQAQESVNFTIILPEYTAGFQFDHAAVLKIGKVESVTLFYKKGKEWISIIESKPKKKREFNVSNIVTINGTKGELIKLLRNKMLRFYIDEVEVIIAGKINEKELARIAESMIQ